MHQPIFGAVAGAPIGQRPLIRHHHPLLDHLTDTIGKIERIDRARQQLTIVLLLDRKEVELGDAHGDRPPAGMSGKGAAYIVHGCRPAALWLGQRFGMGSRWVEKAIFVDVIIIHRCASRSDHFVAPVGPLIRGRHPHGANLNRAIDGAHGGAESAITGIATGAIDILRAVTSPDCLPAPS